mmetsp:Transcript_7625/g.15913  ORF Transcript_7625/g.15913 Transcript_7625/m.15913 type:complete len:201 (+) Transcript_7625:335-937(+)
MLGSRHYGFPRHCACAVGQGCEAGRGAGKAGSEAMGLVTLRAAPPAPAGLAAIYHREHGDHRHRCMPGLRQDDGRRHGRRVGGDLGEAAVDMLPGREVLVAGVQRFWLDEHAQDQQGRVGAGRRCRRDRALELSLPQCLQPPRGRRIFRQRDRHQGLGICVLVHRLLRACDPGLLAGGGRSAGSRTDRHGICGGGFRVGG